jgi:hypothetical protein
LLRVLIRIAYIFLAAACTLWLVQAVKLGTSLTCQRIGTCLVCQKLFSLEGY